MKNNNIPPPLVVENNTVIGIGKLEREPHYENDMCKAVGLISTCNSCDRIIYADETYYEGGYCKQCHEEENGDRTAEPLINITNMPMNEFKELHTKNFTAKYLKGDE